MKNKSENIPKIYIPCNSKLLFQRNDGNAAATSCFRRLQQPH